MRQAGDGGRLREALVHRQGVPEIRRAPAYAGAFFIS